MMLDFSDCQVESITIEARYEPEFALWDRAGAVWTEVQAQFPELRVQAAGPSQVVFESLDTRAVIELEAFRASCRGADAERLVAEVSQRMLQVCSDRLKLAVFKRIGLREIRTRSFASTEAAISAVCSLLPQQIAEGLLVGSKFQAINLGVKQEGETSGLSAAVRAEDREMKLTVPWEVRDRVAGGTPKEHLVLFDSDYYTVGTTRRAALNIEEWAKQATRTIKRYWKGVLK
ncbi:MAG: hypothetical protein ABR898_03960 [Terracidiphilus sp.]